MPPMPAGHIYILNRVLAAQRRIIPPPSNQTIRNILTATANRALNPIPTPQQMQDYFDRNNLQ